MDSPEAAQVPLVSASCEVEATLPQIWFGLPRTLAVLLLGIAVLGVAVVDSWLVGGGSVASVSIVWVAAKGLVARDLWGFDNFLAWLVTDARFLDAGGRDGWGGPRLCALPLSDRQTRGVARAAR